MPNVKQSDTCVLSDAEMRECHAYRLRRYPGIGPLEEDLTLGLISIRTRREVLLAEQRAGYEELESARRSHTLTEGEYLAARYELEDRIGCALHKLDDEYCALTGTR